MYVENEEICTCTTKDNLEKENSSSCFLTPTKSNILTIKLS